MIRLFTDTSANLPLEIIRKENIEVLSFSYTLNGVPAEYSEDTDFDGAWFYGLMRKGVEVKTSLVNVEQFKEAFEKEIKLGNEVLYVGMSGGISGTANAARIAIEELKEEYPNCTIAAIDTYAASTGEGLQVIKAASLIKEGKSFEEVLEIINNERSCMYQIFTVDDLQYLKKGGRISGATALIGNILNIKPILTNDSEGHIVLDSKVRGSKAALKDLADRYDRLCEDKSLTISIAHADNTDGLEYLVHLLRERGFTGDCLDVMYEPVTGSHVGPGAVALFFYGIDKSKAVCYNTSQAESFNARLVSQIENVVKKVHKTDITSKNVSDSLQ
ncbi:MAG: DegV family protein [Lachnospiraceae bacterium]|nr:DegV family protein [Lachnospiraceae bacterium]